jgi:hypothetical protein
MHELLVGAIAVAAFAAGLFFLRYWRSSKDPFFLYLMASFWLQAISYLIVGLTRSWNEATSAQYVVRVLAYGLILLAIWTKNQRRG